MNCHCARAVLDLHLEGRLTVARAKAVDAHLAGCPECRALLRPKAPAASGPARAPEALKAALLKAARSAAPAPRPPEPPLELSLWPREAAGIAFAAGALVVVALIIAEKGVPSQSLSLDARPALVEEP